MKWGLLYILNLIGTMALSDFAHMDEKNDKSQERPECVAIVMPFGHSCFLISSEIASIIIDPFDIKKLEVGDLPYQIKSRKKLTTDYLLISHNHSDHNFKEAIKVQKQTLEPDNFTDEKPVELQKKLVVTRIATFHDDKGGKLRGKNIIHIIDINDVRIVHLGDLGFSPDEEFLQKLGYIDVLMIPVGGGSVIDSKSALKIIMMLRKRIRTIIPMHYKIENAKQTHYLTDELKDFLSVVKKEMKADIAVLNTSYCHCCGHGGFDVIKKQDTNEINNGTQSTTSKKVNIITFSKCK
ncbi:MAG: MBL fold metallo-hydrolase [Planctomycetes bacterium]|nr:MBL fold metallo-hydrolase [Planctomycetota bacterium]